MQSLPIYGRITAVGPGELRTFPVKREDGTNEVRCPLQVALGDIVILPDTVYDVQLIDGDKSSTVIVIAENALLAVVKMTAEEDAALTAHTEDALAKKAKK